MKCAEEGYVDGMTAEGLWETVGSQKFDGKKIWDKVVAVRRETMVEPKNSTAPRMIEERGLSLEELHF